MLSVMMLEEGLETQYSVEEDDFPSDIMRLATRAMKPVARMPARDSTLNCGIFKAGQKVWRRNSLVMPVGPNPTLTLSIRQATIPLNHEELSHSRFTLFGLSVRDRRGFGN